MWQQVLTGELESSAHSAICRILDDLRGLVGSTLSATTLAEISLLYAYASSSVQSHDYYMRSLEYLDEALNRAEMTPRSQLGLFGGLTNLAWLANETIKQLNTVDERTFGDNWEDPLSEVDGFLLRQQEREDSTYDCCDLISGQAGIGLYWLNRADSTASRKGIEQVVTHLERRARLLAPGISWFTPEELVPPLQKPAAPQGYYNLGVAHGVPGVLGVLGQVVRRNPENGKAAALLNGGVSWLLAQRRSTANTSIFSSWTNPGHDGGDSRLAWCYGDLGVASVLHLVATCTSDKGLQEISVEVMNHCLQRDEEYKFLSDTPFCHGAFGIAHIYNRMFHITREERFRGAAVTWLSRGLSMQDPCDGIGGFYFFDPSSKPQRRASTSLLEGGTGVALVLLAAVSQTEPEWDKQLLLSY